MSDDKAPHKLGPVLNTYAEGAWGDLSKGAPEPIGYRVDCSCGFSAEATTQTEVVGLATEHTTPGLGDFARDLYSGDSQ
jgi:hypothetical protein